MRLHEVAVERSRGASRLVGRIERRNGERFELFFEYGDPLPGTLQALADAFVPALLVPAMLANEPLESDLEISPQLLRQTTRVQGILSMWYPELSRVPVELPARSVPVPPGRAVGSFFSAGADSFYTALKSARGLLPPDPVTHLVFMKGFDAGLDQPEALAESEAHVRRVADRLGIPLIVGASNVRDHMRSLWPEAYQGAALGAAGLALTGIVGRMLIPASHTYPELGIPWGSHPLLDEAWTTESVSFLHEGCETFRYDKIGAIAAWDPAALDELRVCLSVNGAPENCGRCFKCVRTMVVLAALGRLGVESFPERLPDNYVELIRKDRPQWRRELLRMASGPAGARLPGLRPALERMERRHQWRSALRTIAELAGVLPVVKSLARAYRSVVRRNGVHGTTLH
jgi:bacterioferritin-associated ferredoxin